MTLTLAIPYFNQLHDTKGIMGLLKEVTSQEVEWLIIDNGSTEPVEKFFRDTLRPKRLNYIKNQDNLGMVKTYQQIFDAVKTDVVAILHNDVFVYEPHWDRRVLKAFQDIDKLGSVGFFGAQGCGPIGQRIQDVPTPHTMSGISNMLEAEVHGLRLNQDYRPAAILDGFAMIFSMEFIRQAGGLDQQYHYHHLYDRDLPLTALSLGYKNIVLNVSCHHVGGRTANSADYQKWIQQEVNRQDADKWTHDENTKIFKEKWSRALPLYVENDFSFRAGQHLHWDYQGNAILKNDASIAP